MENPPMKIDEVLNDVVLLVLDGHDPLKELGIEKNKISYVSKSRPICA